MKKTLLLSILMLSSLLGISQPVINSEPLKTAAGNLNVGLLKGSAGELQGISIIRNGQTIVERSLANLPGDDILDKVRDAIQDATGSFLGDTTIDSMLLSLSKSLFTNLQYKTDHSTKVGEFHIYPKVYLYDEAVQQFVKSSAQQKNDYFNSLSPDKQSKFENELRFFVSQEYVNKPFDFLLNNEISLESNLKFSQRKIRIGHMEMEIKDGFIRSIIVQGIYQRQYDEDEIREKSDSAAKRLLIKRDPTRETFYNEQFDKYAYENEIFPRQQELVSSDQLYIKLVRDSVYRTLTDSNVVEVFQNLYSIGFSSPRNLKMLRNVKLFANSTDGTYITLSDLFSYQPYLEVDRHDLSPTNQVIAYYSNDDNILKVKREKAINLLDVKVYSDLSGLGTNARNGLIQIEFEKKIPMFTFRYQGLGGGVGFAEYVQPYFTINKLENKLKLTPIDLQNGIPQISVSDAFLGKIFTGGVRINLLTYEVQSGKTVFTLDGISELGLLKVATKDFAVPNTGILDTLIKQNDSPEKNLNLFSFGGKLSAEMFPDRDYGLKLSYQLLRSFMPNNILDNQSIMLVGRNTNNPKGLDDTRGRNLHSFSMDAFLEVSAQNKLFVRVAYYFSQADNAENFSQVLFGYRRSLISTLKEGKLL